MAVCARNGKRSDKAVKIAGFSGAKMKYVLLVTWFAYGQQPSSYQTIFNTTEACAAARLAVMMEAQRMLDGLKAHVAAAAQAGKVVPASAEAPTVSTVCTPQG